MRKNLTRRGFLGATGVVAAGLGGAVAQGAEPGAGPFKILGISGSLRKGKTTAAAMKICLEAARAVAPSVQVELVELADYRIPAGPAAGIALEPGERDDFPKLAEKLADPKLVAVIVGTPVYFGTMSSPCKVLLERCTTFRKTGGLSNKVAGVLAVGACRNGGQELTIQTVQAALLSFEMIAVGDARPTGHRGATLVNTKDKIDDDEFGISTAKNLGRRVAEVALRVAAGKN
jgi:multimeric flavodoxin WrbA